MVEYKERLVWAMATSNVSTTALAEHLGISYQAVKKALSGATAALAAHNHAKAARLMRVSSDWLALGEGEPRPSKLSIADLSGPEAQMLGQFRKLPPDDQHYIEVEINNAYVRAHPESGPANPFSKAPFPPNKGRKRSAPDSHDQFLGGDSGLGALDQQPAAKNTGRKK